MSGVYESARRVDFSETDMRRALRPSALLRFFQSAALAHSSAEDGDPSALAGRAAMWAVARFSAEISRLPGEGEPVRTLTWRADARHGLFERYFELLDDNGLALARASSVWLLMDPSSRAMLPGAGDAAPGVVTGRELPPPTRPRLPSLGSSAERVVEFSDADPNGHLNNARYLDWACDAAGESYLASRRERSFAIAYERELRAGACARLDYEALERAFYMRGVSGGRTAFSLEITYELIGE